MRITDAGMRFRDDADRVGGILKNTLKTGFTRPHKGELPDAEFDGEIGSGKMLCVESYIGETVR
ncbi:hypothetical protein [Pelagimonas varians]|uniref:Uncharacterized protein n=2 Tax=Pelagimonas varians TaxID=696760 RepID=A0A238KS78_9RHOB|nr:hypothetical protein [Pelagimonas varians]PYG32496.1 hypothetical protein C8N36_103245 [Pelagimonas varians]SMX45689.1 hypothetical protein PEV8663_03089 [Pelagimonas varians]